MPGGFNTTSGSRLPERLIPVKAKLLSDLKSARERKTVTQKNPISAQTICDRYLKIYGYSITDIDIRAIVNSLRNDLHPIGSNSKGYWYVKGAGEWVEVIAHLVDRRNAIDKVIRSTRSIQASMEQAHLFDHPVVEALQDKLGAERVSNEN